MWTVPSRQNETNEKCLSQSMGFRCLVRDADANVSRHLYTARQLNIDPSDVVGGDGQQGEELFPSPLSWLSTWAFGTGKHFRFSGGVTSSRTSWTLYAIDTTSPGSASRHNRLRAAALASPLRVCPGVLAFPPPGVFSSARMSALGLS